MSLNYTFRIGRGEEFFIPFTDYILPMDDFVANLTWSYASGSPYTPQSMEGNNNFLDTNSKRKAATHSANLRLTKGLRLPNKTNMRLYLEVENLFKKTNINTVYAKTGSPYDTGENIEDTQLGYVFPEVEFTYAKSIRNPANINDFRGVTLGVIFNF